MGHHLYIYRRFELMKACRRAFSSKRNLSASATSRSCEVDDQRGAANMTHDVSTMNKAALNYKVDASRDLYAKAQF
jgi:hypothetical protein